MDNSTGNLLEEADWLFRKLVRRFVKERDKIAIQGVSLPGLLILNSIHQQGNQRLGELAEQLDFTSGAVTALCDKLEDGGYAVRVRSPEDRRTVELAITNKGRELLNETRHVGAYMTGALFEGFEEEELRQQIRFYQKMIRNVEKFSDAVLAYAAEEHEQELPSVAKGTADYSAGRTNRFVSY
ncbi:MarR family winged helix-turn-helix transcriptional regulator [Paenibacillus sp. GCM10027627]|uniref:MarR family winged helix-turn-helix transcriptional regulator n=1 Tax=unclassified Paenibacillus TaxID=185978 RepID=UPI00363EE415